jgi:hypothetical protein
MSRFIKSFILLISMMLLISSCSDDDNPTGPEDLALGELVAEIDGNTWKATFAYFYNNINGITGFEVDVTNPLSSDRNAISLNFMTDNEIQEETYTVFCSYQESSGLDIEDNNAWQDSEGTCVVTEISETEIKGTFSFRGVNLKDDSDIKEISGSFYVTREDNGEL